MLTSFFKTSRPIHYLITFLMVGSATVYDDFTSHGMGWRLLWVPIMAMLCMAVFKFVTIKNNFTQSNSYSLWLHACLLIIGLIYGINLSVFVAYLCFVLALRRVLSIHTGKDVIKKIFDASFWIAVATVFYSWSALFFIVIFISIVLYAFKKLNLWTIPFIAAFCVAILTFTIDQYFDTTYLRSVFQRFDITFTTLKSFGSLFPVVAIVFGFIGFICATAVLLAFPNISISTRARFSLLGFFGWSGVICCAVSGTTLFVIPVIVIFTARLLQESENKVLKESLLWIPVITMSILFFLKF